jgi:hypothetical protein
MLRVCKYLWFKFYLFFKILLIFMSQSFLLRPHTSMQNAKIQPEICKYNYFFIPKYIFNFYNYPYSSSL